MLKFSEGHPKITENMAKCHKNMAKCHILPKNFRNFRKMLTFFAGRCIFWAIFSRLVEVMMKADNYSTVYDASYIPTAL